ncbi:taste receptor type 2 member 10-like [Sphaerodactylus townsendi]|uniref:taste receptor type 2 member 10-like n=1 Tax=Sphaerodactylus townsendi TaxID=933632 RepID=UPI00202641EE|nr:taste receptor type 2 member 10-like [Sphaerodactylus townsendi]
MNAWFATLLGIFYFVKITTFSHPIFLQVKQRISGLVPRLLLGSVALSAITSIMSIIVEPTLSNGLSMYFVSSSLLSINGSEIKGSNSGNLSDIVLSVSTFIPLLLCLSSSVLLIISLWKHKRHLQHNGIGTKDLNTQAHLTAIKALVSFSVLYLSSFLALIAQTILIWNNMDHTWPIMLITNVIAAFPSGHAFILILINPKLKQTWVRILHHLQCCLHDMSVRTTPVSALMLP